MYGDQRISSKKHRKSVKGSVPITPEEGTQYAEGVRRQSPGTPQSYCTVGDHISTVRALEVVPGGRRTSLILNFASAKNPGGGFRMEPWLQESLGAPAALQDADRPREYYRNNRACLRCIRTTFIILRR
ncbi:poly(ADP-ribose) glycohydrolase domain-containing protein [Hungatella sp.]|uniref:poly(ADP-ribose) glycohydrolase domain-containing protein n=1 Tax=Hungatella sp. TaxID=2613924 RepID=UPI003994A116